jgi:hypothetical protein
LPPLPDSSRIANGRNLLLIEVVEIMVRVLGESEWSLYRDVRLGALSESPGSFTASLAEESTGRSSSGVIG